MTFGVLAAALALDAAVGDPDGPLHPVRLMGRLIDASAAWARRRAAGSPRRLRLGGVGVVALVLGAAWAAGGACLALGLWADAHGLDGWGSFAAQTLMVWSCLGARSMREHARAVLGALGRGDLAAARAAVGLMVGRDTAGLDETGVLRACLESVAEGLGDGVLGPLFFAWLGGGPLALVYRAANTLDSMLGHRDEARRDLGWASARVDDVLSWVPAREAALAAALGAWCLGLDARAALRAARRDAKLQPSPNSGWPEAAFAGALGVRLGGPLSYGGVPADKPFLGEDLRPLTAAVCRRGLDLFVAACVVAVAGHELLGLALGR